MCNVLKLKKWFKAGLPKICVPVVGNCSSAVVSEIKLAVGLPINLIEWRMDYLSDDPLQALPKIAAETKDYPLLCTLRSKIEGGESEYSKWEHCAIVEKVIESKLCQIIDIELSLGEKIVKDLILKAEKNDVLTVVSKHDFDTTPAKQEITDTFKRMDSLGADICKYAVMPHSSYDVLKLLEASLSFSESGALTAAIAMGDIGKISRVSGSYFGSCMTFAAGIKASAPGQLKAESMKTILQNLAVN